MAIYVNKMTQLGVYNGSTITDLTAYVKSCTLNMGAEMQDPTAMGATTRISAPGLLTWSIEAELLQDFAASMVDVVLQGRVGQAAFRVNVIPATGNASATNPMYWGNMVIESYTPIAGNVGENAIAKVTFKAAGAIAKKTTSVTITDNT